MFYSCDPQIPLVSNANNRFTLSHVILKSLFLEWLLLNMQVLYKLRSIIAAINFLTGGLCTFIINVCKTIPEHQAEMAREVLSIKLLCNLMWASILNATLT